MPKALAIESGLDWETLASSFWSWLAEALDVVEGRPADDRVTRFVAEQEDAMAEFLRRHQRSTDDRFILAVGLAAVGTMYAAFEKLFSELTERGVFEKPPDLRFKAPRSK